MMGLIQKNLLAGHFNTFTIIFIMILATVAGFIMRAPAIHSMAAFAIGGAFATNFMGHFHRKNDANWQQLETTMPIKLVFIELGRYISFLIVLALIVLTTAIYTLTNYLSGVLDYSYVAVSTFVNSLELACGFFLMLAAIQFPALRLFSAKNSIAVAYGCFVGTLGIFFAAMQIGARLPQSLQDLGQWPFTTAAFLLFVLSFFLSVRLYRRRCSV